MSIVDDTHHMDFSQHYASVARYFTQVLIAAVFSILEGLAFILDRTQYSNTIFYTLGSGTTSNVSFLTQYMATLKPFQAPSAPQPTTHSISALRKRTLEVTKHNHKKLMKRTRELRNRIGK
ncbi:hypothetical protein INT44_008960 [Umbelopsis vinacea]|uniref:Ribosomal protein mS38 C-terminal domain-containing protein n=1 Tax=Umbelopsis vinacea TaxID=44442 RepID=A0A8H7Q2Q4_9FUNG|nr:hypothetical protein INT44_008960 [Umbelopsis vinacea]